MAIDAPATVVVDSSSPSGREQSSYVDWPAIIAGIVLATAISLVLISFGAAVGLNFLDFGYGQGANPIFVGIAAASWFLWVQISSFMAGGYLAGRLRRRYFDATEDESDLRDGAHGLLVWAGAAILGTVIAVGGIGGVAGTAATATTAVAEATGADEALDPTAYYVDTLYRPVAGTPATPVPAETRDETTRIIAAALANDATFVGEDKTYLTGLVQANSGVDEATAINRIDAGFETLKQAQADAVEAARIARNTGIIAAFLLAASLLISAIGAYWSAQKGGNHRDQNTVFADVFRRF